MAGRIWTDDEAIDAWLTFLQASRGRSARTAAAYRGYITKLREYLADHGTALLDADANQVEVFTGPYLFKRGVVARSRTGYISAVRGFYRFAARRSMCRSNPAEGLVHPKAGKPLPRAIGLANAERLMWAPDMNTFIGIRDAAMLAILVGCGPRVSGLVGMNEGDLRTVEVGGKPRLAILLHEKGDKERLVPVPREAEMVLRVYLGHEQLAAVDRDIEPKPGKRDRVLFVSVRSTRLHPEEHVGERRRLTRKAVWDMIRRYGRHQGIPDDELHPHAFRHLFGTELAEDNVNLATAQTLLGHADAKTTAIYSQVAQRRKFAVIDAHAPLAKINTPMSDLLKRLPPG